MALGSLLLVGVVRPATVLQDLEYLPGEADGELAPALAEALEARDVLGPEWAEEARVGEWTARLRAELEGGDTSGSTRELRFSDRRGTEWEKRYEGGGWTVERRATATAEPPEARLVPLAAWRTELAAYGSGRGEGRLALKVVGIEPGPEGVRTRVRAEVFAERSGVREQLVSDWLVVWGGAGSTTGAEGADTEGEDAVGPIVAFEWVSEERARLARQAFVDATGPAFARSLPSACALGLPTWRKRLDSLLGAGLLGHHGLAVGDVDADGFEDLYVCQPGGLPNRLFLSGEGGALVDATSRSGADYLDWSASALLVHLDDDGHLDLVVATATEILLHTGDGEGAFELALRVDASTTTSLAAADYDLDGDLDIYVCGYVSPYNGSATPLPYHDANNGVRNQLLRNEGDFAFANVADEVGLGAHERFTFAAAWADYDRDGDPDLYVANDFGRNNLYRNEDGYFVDVAAELGVEDMAAGMGVAWGDVDGDGFEDLYVSNMFSAAGSRVAYQPAFQPDGAEFVRSALQRHARGNTLFRNVGGERFEDVTAQAGVAMGRWAWGSILFDFNDDGWLDALVPNGMITGHRVDDL